MNNKKKIILIVSLVILVILFVLLINNKPKNQDNNQQNSNQTTQVNKDNTEKRILYEPADPMTNEEKSKLGLNHLGVYDVTARDQDGNPTKYKNVGLEEPKEIVNVDWMTEREKKILGLGPEIRIQVLERSASGSVISWRLIKDDSDIITRY